MGLALVEFVVEVEKSFDIRLPDSEFGKMITVHDVATYVLALRADGSDGIAGALTRELVQERLGWILSDQFGVPVSMIGPETRLLDLAPDG